MTTFPVSQSVLDADALTKALTDRYGLRGDVKCRLLSRGMNDIYRVDHQDGPNALKVARTGKSSDDEFAYEKDYILHLANKGIEVPCPVTSTDGSLFFSVKAPEGKRQIVLMAWLDGKPYQGVVSADEAAPIGRLLAELHLAAADFSTPHGKAVATERKIQDRLPYLLNLLIDFPDDVRFLERVSEHAIDISAKLGSDEVPSGPCHGDLQNANVMKKADGSLAVFDFSDCGTDRLAKDIAAFYWRNDFEGLSHDINDAFLEGYGSVRPLTHQERDAQPIFRILRHLFIASTMAQHINRVGPVRGFDKNVT